MVRLLVLLLTLAGAFSALADSAVQQTPAANQVPAWIIEVPESVNDVLVADTSDASLHRFRRDTGGVAWVDERYMSIGLNGAGKQRAWDRKTPLGTYFITERLDTSKLHDKYGVAAFPLDYPNAWDRRLDRTGYGIWLHGVDHKNPERPPRDTDGCLAIRNEALLQIADDLEPLVTPVIVASEMSWTTPQAVEETRLALRFVLDQWHRSLESGDILDHMALYSDDFSYLGMNKADWGSYRLQVFENSGPPQFVIEDILLMADPVEPDLYLSRFTQVLANSGEPTRVVKRLYWRRLPGDRWEIVSEDTG